MTIASFEDLFFSLPEKERKMVENPLRERYSYVHDRLNQYPEYECNLSIFHQSGNQWIADFEVKDLSKPVEDKYNFHLQNTSQWVWAGCILVQNGQVSIHT